MNEENQKKEVKIAYLKSKPRFEALDGLRGVASIIVVIFHLFEVYSDGPTNQIINHGYLAVDFFYVLSGFVMSYAYDDRWNKMSLCDFYKRRLIRLHPMLVAGNFLGIFYFFFAESEVFPNIKNVKPHVFFLTILLNFFMIPTPTNFDVRGWGETNAFNGNCWTLTYEYLINILYSLIIYRLHTIIIGIITLLSAFLTINLTLNFDVFNVLADRESNNYTVIGGWELSSCEIYVAFARLIYPFFCGYLISRLKLKINLSFSFIICSIILTICLAFPRVGGDKWIYNGIYETIVIILIFPFIIILGAGETNKNENLIKICNFLGEFSYPLYISHAPLFYLNFTWRNYHADDSNFNKIGVCVGSFFIIMFNTYALIKLFDQPMRKWLTEKYLIKKNNVEKNIEKNIENIDKDEGENNKIIVDESPNDIEEEKKLNLINENNNNEN